MSAPALDLHLDQAALGPMVIAHWDITEDTPIGQIREMAPVYAPEVAALDGAARYRGGYMRSNRHGQPVMVHGLRVHGVGGRELAGIRYLDTQSIAKGDALEKLVENVRQVSGRDRIILHAPGQRPRELKLA